MIIAIVFNKPSPGKPDSEDVVREVEFIEAALHDAGHTCQRIALEPDIAGVGLLCNTLGGADAVFNLVESPAEDASLHPAAAALFALMQVPFTGSPYEALLMTTHKALCKTIMRASGIDTPQWALYPQAPPSEIWERVSAGKACIAKPLLEDASLGIDDSSVFNSPEELSRGLAPMHSRYGGLLVEGLLEGREFNVSVIEDAAGRPRVLPVAEMTFRDWPSGKPRIVNYSAKWDAGSFEFNNTVRAFGVGPQETRSLSALALRCWDTFGLRGYARVDIRMDSGGRPYVLEVNANPCISPDSGFIAAADEAGLSPGELVSGILASALRQRSTT